ncbi:expressed unknown protein [Seminavis robusta]|uniref:RanBP2-type domain-containing protein n=1 Tax=Seminavis robusta TaxID=568900 RepID=A0A9N8HV33_9STRA|nr:expressed unknown protein [Seminavis robusta]|eukprot:Sro2228_g319880.1 n/a (417) ;mRNA; r:9057-10307
MSGGINEATLRRLQQRLVLEGYKDPSDAGSDTVRSSPEEADPAKPEEPPQQPHVIRPHMDEAERLREQREEELLAQYRRDLERRRESSDRRSTSITDDQTMTDSEIAELTQQFGQQAEAALWQCECGHESPLEHNFCGVCGLSRPVDWWCENCQIENPHFHHFCSQCGAPDLEYEDMSAARRIAPPTTILHHPSGCEASVLTEDAEIERAVARMTLADQRHHPQPWPDEEDDGVTFADDANDMVSRAMSRQQQPEDATLRRLQQRLVEEGYKDPSVAGSKQQQQPPPKPQGWSCGVCTYHNENQNFLSCEMCGSHRPASPTNGLAPQEEEPPLPAQQHQHRRRPSLGAASKDSDKKEMRFTDLLRRQADGGVGQPPIPSTTGQQQEQLAGADNDLELAMIYAQQERMLAEFQNQGF